MATALQARAVVLMVSALMSGCTMGDMFVVQAPGLPPAAPAAADPQPGRVQPPVSPDGPSGVAPAMAASLRGQATLNGTPLAFAHITVFRISDLRILADGVVTDDFGRFVAPLTESVPEGQSLLVLAAKGQTTLYGINDAQSSLAIQAQPADVGALSLRLDLASTVVTKRVLPKLAEVLISHTGSAASLKRQASLLQRLGTLVRQTVTLLEGPVHDTRLQQAIGDVGSQPNDGNIDRLADAFVAYGPQRPDIVGVIDGINQSLIDNLGEGGLPIRPRPWHVQDVTVETPRLTVVGSAHIQLDYQGRSVITGMPLSILNETHPVLQRLDVLLHNEPSTPAIRGGGTSGGGGGAGVPVTPPAIGFGAALTVTDGSGPILLGRPIATAAGNTALGWAGDGGLGPAATLNIPTDVALDRAGNLYIADTYNTRIRRVDAVTNLISTIAGASGSRNDVAFSGDGGPAIAARFSWTGGLAFDSVGNLCVADTLNHRIRRIAADTGIVTTIAGSGTANGFNPAFIPFNIFVPTQGAFAGDSGPATAAKLSVPAGIAFDAADNLYIADTISNRIRKVAASDGTISTFAGTGVAGGSGDAGQASLAQLNNPSGLTFDRAGNLYVSEYTGQRLRKITMQTGIITLFAGTGISGISGDNGPANLAKLGGPSGIGCDRDGNLYIAEKDNRDIRKVTAATGIITTFSGAGPYAADGLDASAVVLTGPTGVTVSALGAVYIAERGNSKVRVVR